MMGFAAWEALSTELAGHRARGAGPFGNTFAERGNDDEPWPQHPRLEALRAGQRYAALPDASRRRPARGVPALARPAAATPDPEATLARGIARLEGVAGRAAYVALLGEQPGSRGRD